MLTGKVLFNFLMKEYIKNTINVPSSENTTTIEVQINENESKEV